MSHGHLYVEERYAVRYRSRGLPAWEIKWNPRCIVQVDRVKVKEGFEQ